MIHFKWKDCVQLHDLLDHVIGNSFVNDKLDYFNNLLLNLWNWHVNDSLRCAFLHALLWHDAQLGRFLSLCIVNVGLLDHFLSIFICELLTHTFLHEALNLCTRLQLHSAARTLRSCWVTGIVCSNFSCGTSTVFSACWLSSPEVGGNQLRHHVCRKTCVLDCLEYASWHVRFALWALVWATHGLPVVRAPVYRGCPCRDPLGCHPMPKQDGIGSRAPTLCGCAVLVVVDL